MASATIRDVRIAGIAAAVPGPAQPAEEGSAFSLEELSRITRNTGVSSRHLADTNTCTSDLCLAAAERLLDELQWPRDSVSALIFVSQTPDYLLPATACSLHGRLNLSKSCAALDVNLGCSGYVYGLWLAGSVMSQNLSRVLLLAGDTISRITAPEDRSVASLFGDAGTATALEFDTDAPPMFFELGTDGSGAQHLMVKAGGFRNPHSEASCMRSERERGNLRSDEDLFMDGGEILAFTLNAVPALCRDTLALANWPAESVDAFVMHQANRFMLQNLAKVMKLPKEKVVITLENYGNTSSASIPLAMIESLSKRPGEAPSRILLAGFGVGFSWAAAAIELGRVAMLPVIVLPHGADAAAL